MEEQEASDYLFLVANQSARNSGRSLIPNAEAFLRDMTAKAGHVIGQLNDPGVQEIQLRQAESDIKEVYRLCCRCCKDHPELHGRLAWRANYERRSDSLLSVSSFLLIIMNLEGAKANTETAKQIIALFTGAIAFTVTFIEKFKAPVNGGHVAPLSLYATWVLFGLNIASALWYLMALNGNISAVARKENGWDLNPAQRLSANGDEGNTVVPGWLMMISFLLSVGSLIWLGFNLAQT